MQHIHAWFHSLKRLIIQYRFLFLLLAVAVLLLPFLPPSKATAPDVIYFFGRFHPLLVHFPVVLIGISLVFELARKFRLWSISTSTIGILLGISFVSSLVSVILGFMLYYTGEYVGNTMDQHMWGGVLLTSFSAIALYLFLSYSHSTSKVIYAYYLSSLVLANFILVFTSHQGGSLTHGSEYLTEYMPALIKTEDNWKPKPVEQMLVYEDMIMPVLDRKCMSCHNENKAKGDLILISYQDMLKGGKSKHPTLKPGSAADSELYKRMMLPEDDDDRMPPKGKVSLTKEEITLLAWWIDKGADTTLKVQQASKDAKIASFLTTYLADLEAQQQARLLQQQGLEKLIQTVSQKGDKYVLKIDPYEDKAIILSMSFPPSAFADNDLISLQPVFSSITKASFIASHITDDALYHIGQMTNLQELYLQQTQIKGAGLVHLSSLPKLKLLDLSSTAVNDGQMLHILQFPALEDVYVNETSVSKEVIEAIGQYKPQLKIHMERGKLF